MLYICKKQKPRYEMFRINAQSYEAIVDIAKRTDREASDIVDMMIDYALKNVVVMEEGGELEE